MLGFGRRQRQLRAEEAQLDIYLSKVKFIPGGLEVCQSILGYHVEYFVLKSQDTEVTYARRNSRPFVCISPMDVKRELVKQGVVALAHVDNALSIDDRRGYVYERKYGIPVVKKEKT